MPLIEVEPDLADYYRGNVIGGPNAFVVVARQLSNFSEAVLKKLLVEIAGSEGMQKGLSTFDRALRGIRL